MERLHALGAHLLPQSAAAPQASLQESASPSVAPASLAQDPSEELISQHLAGSGILWCGPKNHVGKAMELFFAHGVTNFPLVDVMEETRVGLNTLRKVLENCEKDKPNRPTAAWSTQNILLTGGTGFIGIHFLAKLVRAFPKAHIWCLVRGRNQEHCRERLHAAAKPFSIDEEIGEEWKRVHAVQGDITMPHLGLASSDYDELVGSVDTVLHLAAKDNFFLPFQVLRKPHIDGVLNVIEFCARRKVKSLMHMSTCKYRLIEESGGKIIPNDGLYDGYAQSKYVGHRMAEEVRASKLQCAPPIALVNMAYVHLETSPPVVPDITDAWEVVMKVCLERGVMPEIDVPMDFVPIGYATDCLVEIIENCASGELDGHPWLEVYSPHGLSFRDVREALQKYRAGNVPRLVSMAEFARHWQEVLWASGTSAGKCLSVGVTGNFVEQTTTVFSLGPNCYRSRKHGTPPKITERYLLELLQTIDSQMVLNR